MNTRAASVERLGFRSSSIRSSRALASQLAPELVVVVPTYCERDNIGQVVRRLRHVLTGIRWEAVFVDDDSPDGTAKVVRHMGRADPRVRCVHRLGRRGLAGACIEGMLASAAPLIAVIDADLQHDETVLPRMLQCLREGSAELVVATRYGASGSVGDWDTGRAAASRHATYLSHLLYRHQVSDPMSGFFMLKRELFEEAMRKLSTSGFKLLLDLLASIDHPIAVKEVPYTFRSRLHGESKLDSVVVWDFGMLMLDKLVGRYVPMRFVAFSLVGGAGIAVHMAIITLLLSFTALSFPVGQSMAAICTMVFNYAVNNVLTYRDQRRRGLSWVTGLFSFMVACGLGALANVTIATSLFSRHIPWALAALAGIVVGAVWNYAMTSRFTWGKTRSAR